MRFVMEYKSIQGTAERDSLASPWRGVLSVAGGNHFSYKAETLKGLRRKFEKKVEMYIKMQAPMERCLPEYRHRRSNLGKTLKRFVADHTKKESILETAGRIINGERQDSYGAPEDSFQIIAEYWSTYLNGKFKKRTPDFKFVLDPVDVANLQILFKQARKLGQKPHRDNYVDSVGYEAIAADRLSSFEE